MRKPETAERAYARLFSKPYIETGPRLVKPKLKKYISLDDLLTHGEPYVAGVGFGAGHVVIDVPGPWHALAAAMVLQHRALANDGQHLIFRGQANSAYKLVASLFRPGAQTQTLDRAKRLLAWFLAANCGSIGAINPPTFYGVAQHYGIWTDLLDFTPDPAVATFFASQESKGDCPTSSVYVLQLDWAASMHCVLPPPFVERLYRQRGIFIQCPSAEPLPMDRVVELRFPANVDGKLYDFHVIRHGKRVDILGDHSWIRKVVDWACSVAADPSIAIPTQYPTQLGPGFALFLKGVGHAKILNELLVPKKAALHQGAWLDGFNDQLYWLAYRFDDSKPGHEESINFADLTALVDQNPSLARTYVEFGRRYRQDDPVFMKQIWLIEEILK